VGIGGNEDRCRVGAELALVVIGAWDVFDVELDDQVLAFDSPAGDQRFVDGVQRGIDALTFAGVRVALLEVPCMRPQNVKGAGVPALPERGDDARATCCAIWRRRTRQPPRS